MSSPLRPPPAATDSLPTRPLDADTLPRLGSAFRQGHHHVIALEPVAAGGSMLQLQGLLASTPNRYSLQLAADQHLVPPADLRPDQVPDPYLWRYLNHGCRPNAALEGRCLVALRDIAAGEEVTFDYNSTEYEMAEPFVCHCGDCDGRTIRGFKHLSAEERALLAPYLAPHLARLLPGAS